MSYLQELGKSNILDISSPNGGNPENGFNFNNTNYWSPQVSIDDEGYLDEPAELYVTFNKFLNVKKLSVSIGLFNSDDFKFSLGSPRDFQLYTSSTCIKEIPECKDECTIPDPMDPEAEILIDYAPEWKLALDVKGRGTYTHPLFNAELCSSPYNMSTSLVYGSTVMYSENKSPSFMFDNFELSGGTTKLNKIKFIITRVNLLENINNIPLRVTYLGNLRLLGFA